MDANTKRTLVSQFKAIKEKGENANATELRAAKVIQQQLRKVGVVVSLLPSRTKSSFKDEVNINSIIARHHRGQPLPVGAAGRPMFGDFSDSLSYRESMDKLVKTQEQFDSLPSNIRNKFNNDPGALIDYVLNLDLKDEEAVNEALKLGILDRSTLPDREDRLGEDQEGQTES